MESTERTVGFYPPSFSAAIRFSEPRSLTSETVSDSRNLILPFTLNLYRHIGSTIFLIIRDKLYSDPVIVVLH